MSNKQKTAVDLLLDKITDYEMGETLLRLIGKDEIDHIRKVEREQIVESVNHTSKKDAELANNVLTTYSKIRGRLFHHDENIGEKYYKETYGE